MEQTPKVDLVRALSSGRPIWAPLLTTRQAPARAGKKTSKPTCFRVSGSKWQPPAPPINVGAFVKVNHV